MFNESLNLNEWRRLNEIPLSEGVPNTRDILNELSEVQLSDVTHETQSESLGSEEPGTQVRVLAPLPPRREFTRLGRGSNPKRFGFAAE